MLKKYFILVFIFTSFVFLNNRANAESFLDTGGVNTCTSKLINATATNIVSEADLSMNIDVCVVTGSNPPFTIVEQKNPIGFSATTSINTNVGTTSVAMPYTFEKASITGNESIKYTIYDSSTTTLTDNAFINAYVDITPISLTNNRGLTTSSSTLAAGQNVTFTCTNSTELYYDPVANATNTPVVSDYTGATLYNLVYTITPTPGYHTIECDNIAGSLTRKTFTFYADSNKLDINNTSYSPTTALSTVHFTWDSNGTNCSFYNYDKSVKFGNASGNAGAGFAYDLTSPNTPSGANSYGYYIKCYDSTKPNSDINTANALLASSTESISGVNTTVAWYPISASFTCPSGYNTDTSNNNACVLPPPPNPPTCAFTNDTSSYISCTCPGSDITALTVESTDGSSQVINPPTASFAWNNLQYRYSITCTSGSGGGSATTMYAALQRPYTHFLSFNVSAGYVKPGGEIDMNWVVQDPTSTCKIVGIDLKTGSEIFNSTSGNYGPVNSSLTVSKSSSATRNFTDGSFKNLMGKGLTLNSSARFTASCENNSVYMPGHYQLVRDVYTTTSQEQ